MAWDLQSSDNEVEEVPVKPPAPDMSQLNLHPKLMARVRNEENEARAREAQVPASGIELELRRFAEMSPTRWYKGKSKI